MFDAAVVVGRLPGGSFFALLAEHGDRIVRDWDFAECYSSRMGRPSIPPSLLAKVMLCSIGPGLAMSRRWSVWCGICGGRSRWGCRSIIRGGIRRR